jgi:hypothetical protein
MREDNMEIRSHPRTRFSILPVRLCVCVAVLAARSAIGAGPAGRIDGRTTDPQGAAVSGTQIKITDPRNTTVCETKSDPEGYFVCREIGTGQFTVTAAAAQFAPVIITIHIVSSEGAEVNLQFSAVASEKQAVTVVASAPSVLTPDPAERVVVHDQVLDANPGRPGAPVSIPGLPIETASGGIKAPQYFAPGVAGDHGEPIAQFFRVGDYLYPNNLPANAHGNGYADPNFLIAPVIDAVQVDGGAFDVREGNNAVNLAASYEPRERLNRFMQLTGDYRDFDILTGWSPLNPDTHAWLALEGSFGNGFLKRLEHRQQYKLNGYREFKAGSHDLSLFGIGYYGFSRNPGLIPTDVPVPDDTIDYRQLDRTHTTLMVASDTWRLDDSRQFLFSGFFRTYSLTLRSNFGDGLIQQSEFRTVVGGEAAYVQKIRPWLSLLAGLDLRRDAPRGLDLKRLDQEEDFQLVTSNDLTLAFAEPFASLDGELGKHFHFDLGVRREEVTMDNVDKLSPANSFNRLAGLTLPKATFTVLPPDGTPLPSLAFSYGEAFHTNDPRIGMGTQPGTVIAPSRAFQLVLRKEFKDTDIKMTLARVTSAQQLAKIDPDTGLQENVGPSLARSLTISAQHYFRHGSLYASFARANAIDRLTGEDIPEAPRLIWDAVGTLDRLPFRLQARSEFECVGRKPLGDGFTSIPVRELRGALLRPFGDGRMSVGVNILLASGFTGQTLETLALSTEPAPFERIVGVPLKSYVSMTWTYNFGVFSLARH